VNRRAFVMSLAAGGAALLAAACQQRPATPAPASSAQPATGAQPSPGAQSGAAPAAAQPAAAGPTFDQLLDGAKREGQLIWSGAVPQTNTALNNKLIQAFNQKFGTSIQVQVLTVPTRDLPSRLVTEARGNTSSVDVAWGSMSGLMQLDTAGLLDPFDWGGVFGARVTGVQDSAKRLDDFFSGGSGKGLEWFHLMYCLVYNTRNIKPDELPKRWEDLADPRWKGQFGFSSLGTPFAILGLKSGEEAASAAVQKIVANQPKLGRGSPEIVELVSTGEVAFGVSGPESVESAKRSGAPVDWVVVDPAAFTRTGIFVPKHAPHPNAARLFAAWAAHEGLTIMEQESGGVGQVWPGSGFEIARRIEEIKATIITAENRQQLQAESELGAKLARLVTQS
jgi:iron(III) transport system substrate-binding protein